MSGPAGDSAKGDLAALLRPRAIAILGASDRSRWSQLADANLRGFAGPVHLVNRRGGIVHGRAAAESCAALGEPVDLGIVLVPAAAAADALADLGRAGARAAVVLTSGFAETGAEGAALQETLRAAAARAGIRMLGPNCLGFVNFADEVRAWTTTLETPVRRDGVAVVSQSGATALFLADLALRRGVGLSHLISTGNEADLDAASFLDHLVDDPATRAVALFVETLRRPERFLAAAGRALAAGKPIVVLKAGASEVAARAATAHTGALVGDDRVFEGLCRQFGLIRVRTIEDLLATADLVARTGPLRPGGLCVVSNSGGICEIAADAAAGAGLELPPVEPARAAAVAALMPGYATAQNPLDLTGGIEPAHCEGIVRELGGQSDYAALLCPFYAIPNREAEESPRLTALHGALAAGLTALPIPGLLVSYTATDVTPHARSIADAIRAPYLACGLDRAVMGLAGAMRWSERLRGRRGEARAAATSASAAPGLPPGAHPRGEGEALAFLARHGVPVVPTTLARSAEEACRAARALGGPAVLKIASPDIAHKSDVGGVALGLEDDAAVAAAYERIVVASRAAVPAARIDGVLVAPMRERGLELLVGLSRDPQWGLVLAVGLGGVFVEVLEDVSLRVLHDADAVDAAEARRMLDELRGAKMLAGARGIPAADRDAVAAAIVAIGRAALAAGPDLMELDVNPLWVRGDRVEALDALFVWEGADAEG